MYGCGSLIVLALMLASSINITIAATIYLNPSTVSSTKTASVSARDVTSQLSSEVPLLNKSLESSSISPALTNEQECGIRGKPPSNDTGTKTDYTDYGGRTVLGEFPWIAALLKVKTNNNSTGNGEIICGASVISPFIVLTAAHCVNKIIEINELKVRVGEYNITNEENKTLSYQYRTVNAIHIHPNYNPKKLFNDLALLSVNEPFVYDSYVNGICAPLVGTPYAEKDSYNPKQCWAVGWVKHTTEDGVSVKLQKKVEFTMGHDECQQKFRATKLGAGFILDSSFVCATGYPDYDSCTYTAGGWLLFCLSRTNENKLIQVGTQSWSVGCSTANPAVYASLEANKEWLTNEINTMTVSRMFL